MKKTLFITYEFPPDTGGISSYISMLAKHFPSDKVFVLADSHGPAFNEYDLKQNYIIERKHINPQWRKALKYARQLCSKHNIEMIVVNHILPLGYIALMLNKLRGIPYIVCIHGMDIKLALRNTWKRFLVRRILNSSKYIVTNSNFTSKIVTDFDSKYTDKVHVVYPCPKIDSYNYRHSDRLRRIYGKRKVLLTVSRLVQRKGHRYVIRLLPKLLKKYPNLIYLIVGTGPYRQQLEAEIRQNKVMHAVEFADYVDDEGLKDYFEVCDVFVMPTESRGADVEGLGIVFLEAGHFKKPVIGGAGGGVEEAITDGQTGFVVNPDNPDELFNALDKILGSSDLARKLGEEGYSRVIENFTWEKQAAELMKLLG